MLAVIHFNHTDPGPSVFPMAVDAAVDTNGLSLCGKPQLFKTRNRMAIVRTFVARLAGRIVHFRITNCHPIVLV